jgi:hypothetical protein
VKQQESLEVIIIHIIIISTTKRQWPLEHQRLHTHHQQQQPTCKWTTMNEERRIQNHEHHNLESTTIHRTQATIVDTGPSPKLLDPPHGDPTNKVIMLKAPQDT